MVVRHLTNIFLVDVGQKDTGFAILVKVEGIMPIFRLHKTTQNRVITQFRLPIYGLQGQCEFTLKEKVRKGHAPLMQP